MKPNQKTLDLEQKFKEHVLSTDTSNRNANHFNLLEIYPDTESLEKLTDQVDDLKKCLDSFRPLSPEHITKLEEAFDTEYTYDSNRIEGNSLTLQETDMVINRGLTVGGKPLKDHLEAINHRDALNFVRALATKREDLNERHLLTIHGLILRGIDPINAARYRRDRVRISGSRHIPPNPLKLSDLMPAFFADYETKKATIHPVILAANIHQGLVSIHPFTDGNGRTARLIMNLILLRNGYPVANISGERTQRNDYYDSLEKSHMEGGLTDFQRLILRTEKAAQIAYLNLFYPDVRAGRGVYFLEKIAPLLKG